MKVMVGLEIHGYLNTKQKLFCECSADYINAEPNVNTCPICTGMPGSKPMAPNKRAVDLVLRVAKLTNCKINNELIFQRKHYDWPDMPTGYQKTISGSYSNPVGVKGEFRGVGIWETHLEEDPARWDPKSGLVDFNRAGVPLIEFVTAPDFTGADDVRIWLTRFVQVMDYLDALRDNMIKADVNISVNGGTRVEVKNINSFQSIVDTVNFEIKRQIELSEAGKPIVQETRTWDDNRNKTISMRSKESAADYRFIPDPDVLPITLTKSEITKITSALPELPDVKIARFVKAFNLKEEDAVVLAGELTLANWFEKIAKEVDPQFAAKWLRKELVGVARYNKLRIRDLNMEIESIRTLLILHASGKLTRAATRDILLLLLKRDFDVETYAKKNDLIVDTSVDALEPVCKDVISEYPKPVEDFKSGNDKSINFLVGMVIKKIGRKASPKDIESILRKLLK